MRANKGIWNSTGVGIAGFQPRRIEPVGWTGDKPLGIAGVGPSGDSGGGMAPAGMGMGGGIGGMYQRPAKLGGGFYGGMNPFMSNQMGGLGGLGGWGGMFQNPFQQMGRGLYNNGVAPTPGGAAPIPDYMNDTFQRPGETHAGMGQIGNILRMLGRRY